MILARRKFKVQLKQRVEAVTTLQAAWRGHVVRRNIQSALLSINVSLCEVDLSDCSKIANTQTLFFCLTINNMV